MFSQTLTAMSSSICEHKKLFLTAMMLGALSSTIFINSSQAAIPVIDSQNIQEAVKILEETNKVTQTLGKQLGLSEQDLKNINEAVNHYTTLINKHSKNLELIFNNKGGYVAAIKAISEEEGKGNFNTAEQWLAAIIPAVTDNNGNISFNAQNIARLAAQGAIMTNNADVLEAMKQIQVELNNSESVLQDLLKQNAELGIDNGTLAAQQLNNEIKGLQTHISVLNSQMDALNNQAKILQMQSEAQDKQNEITVATSQAEANTRYVEENIKQYTDGETIKIVRPWDSNN